MQGYITINGRNAKSKAEVKRALNDEGNFILFHNAPSIGNGFIETRFSLRGDSNYEILPRGNHVFIGPDYETKRTFYGNVSRSEDGKVTIK